MKAIKFSIASTALALSLAHAGAFAQQANSYPRGTFEFPKNHLPVGAAVMLNFPPRVFVDPDTGCQYLVLLRSMDSPMAAMPRLDKNGRPMCPDSAPVGTP